MKLCDRIRSGLVTTATAVGLLALLSACGGGGSSAAPVPPPAQPETGELALTVTDAPGDFVAYIVDVTSIRLERANGDSVETLPLDTRIDFTQLADVSEFLTVATVPAGIYESITVSLDFSAAEILVQNAAGEAVAADVVDAAGDPVTTLDVSLSLADGSTIRVTPATVRGVSLDFDLDASNSIEDGVDPPVVTVEPVLLAVPELEADREHRLRGLLAEVDEAAGSVTLAVRPFRHRGGAFGELAFAVDEDTTYEIDGEVFEGGVGLEALAELGQDTPVVAQGTVTDGTLLAARVIAGSSVFWSDADVVHGVVRARDGAALTLGGVAVEFADGRFSFRREITVLLGDDTVVTAPGESAGALDQLDVSVGARIAASGEFVDDLTLDAATGRVRLLVSRLWGDVVQTSPLVVDLHLLNGRLPQAFDFTGTGVTAAEDADPVAYEIDAVSLGLLDLEPDDLVQVRGLVNRFGFAPPDFTARTVTDVATEARGATAAVAWPGGSATPFLATAPRRLDLDLDTARAVLKLKGHLRDLPFEPDDLALVAPQDGDGIYAVAERGADALTLYRSFADAVDAMMALLDSGATLHRFTGHGRYTQSSGELTTARGSFVFEVADSGADAGE